MGEGGVAEPHDKLAAELDRAGALLEHLAVGLCLDPVVFERHAERLQQFDQVTQTIGEIARLLRSRESWGDALAAVRLDTMRARLTDG